MLSAERVRHAFWPESQAIVLQHEYALFSAWQSGQGKYRNDHDGLASRRDESARARIRAQNHAGSNLRARSKGSRISISVLALRSSLHNANSLVGK